MTTVDSQVTPDREEPAEPPVAREPWAPPRLARLGVSQTAQHFGGPYSDHTTSNATIAS
jgi:hypothetical protein